MYKSVYKYILAIHGNITSYSTKVCNYIHVPYLDCVYQCVIVFQLTNKLNSTFLICLLCIHTHCNYIHLGTQEHCICTVPLCFHRNADSITEPLVQLCRIFPRGHWLPCRCKHCHPLVQLLKESECSGHRLHTLSGRWTIPLLVHLRTATPPLDQDILQQMKQE